MKTGKIICKILESIWVYVAVILVMDLLFSLVYYNVMIQSGVTFQHVYIQTIAGKLKSADMGDRASVVQAVQNLVEVIASAVLTGYILTYLRQRLPKVSLVDYLVIRRRTSENVKDQLSLGVMSLNKSAEKMVNVKCYISCAYVNLDNKYINAEYHDVQEAVHVQNYTRFSFPLELLPRKLMRDFLSKDQYCLENDSITITLTGEYGVLMGSFRIEKKYKLKDIVIVNSEDVEYKKKKRKFITSEEYNIVDWKLLKKRPNEISENERKDIIKEIEEMSKSTF